MVSRNAQLRARGQKRAMSLASEQAEQFELIRALALVRRYERRLQHAEDRKQAPDTRLLRKHGRQGGRFKKSKRAYNLQYKAADMKVKTNEACDQLKRDILGRLQECLRRYTLRKTARTRFSLRCSQDIFIMLLGGHVDIHMHHSGKKMRAELFGEDGEAVGKKLQPILGCEENWFIRRWYGEDPTAERDCSFIDIQPDIIPQRSVMFTWTNKEIEHLDHKGELRQSQFSRMVVSFPRSCEPVEPCDD